MMDDPEKKEATEETAVWHKEFLGLSNIDAVVAEARFKAMAEAAVNEFPREET